MGGHAYVINGVNTIKKQFRLKNSWGRKWGQGGHAFISFDDMKKLINHIQQKKDLQPKFILYRLSNDGTWSKILI